MKRIETTTVTIKLGNSFPPIRFGGILLQPITWQVNRPSTCIFSHMTFLMSHVTFSNNTCG
jgi:hypothetical protein